MQVFKHKRHIAYQILKNKVVAIRYIDDGKIRFYFKGHGFANFKFRIAHLGKFITIRCPIFYFNRDNGGFHIGLPNLYIWFIT